MSGTEPPLDDLDPRLTAHPIPRVFRHDKPGWEILCEGTPIGTIQQTRIGRAQSPFYLATGYFPDTGEPVGLELSTSFSERCNVLLAFHEDPDSSVHLPKHLRRRAR